MLLCWNSFIYSILGRCRLVEYQIQAFVFLGTMSVIPILQTPPLHCISLPWVLCCMTVFSSAMSIWSPCVFPGGLHAGPRGATPCSVHGILIQTLHQHWNCCTATFLSHRIELAWGVLYLNARFTPYYQRCAVICAFIECIVTFLVPPCIPTHRELKKKKRKV